MSIWSLINRDNELFEFLVHFWEKSRELKIKFKKIKIKKYFWTNAEQTTGFPSKEIDSFSWQRTHIMVGSGRNWTSDFLSPQQTGNPESGKRVLKYLKKIYITI